LRLAIDLVHLFADCWVTVATADLVMFVFLWVGGKKKSLESLIVFCKENENILWGRKKLPA